MSASLRRAIPCHETARRAALAILLLCALAACEPFQRPVTPDIAATGENRAAELSARGMHSAAADAYLDLARQADPIARQRYLMLAARERSLAGDPRRAQIILDELPQPILSEHALLWAQVTATVALAGNDPERRE